MGADQTDVSRGAQRPTPTHDLPAQGDGRGPVYCVERLCLADATQILSCDFDGAWLFLRLVGQRLADDDSPSAGVIDSQSVKITESVGPRGYDAVKKTKGRKRHIITDTQGFLIGAVIHAADIQDRDGAPDVLASVRYRFPWLRHVFAGGGYAGDKLRAALAKIGKWTLEIIKRSDHAKGFVLLPRRRVVERTFAWLNRNRRLAKDFERTIESVTAWLIGASVQMLTRRIARPCNHSG